MLIDSGISNGLQNQQTADADPDPSKLKTAPINIPGEKKSSIELQEVKEKLGTKQSIKIPRLKIANGVKLRQEATKINHLLLQIQILDITETQ